ncbi:MAG TPA: cupredoxin domain-containing protein [Candidatus Dormibacteraeota bacterium]|nr:cupredoxin domain-containing protein [Candidatus Dormibacteraeota bacterium]
MRSRVIVFALLLALLAGVGVQPFSLSMVPAVQEAHATNVAILLNGFVTGWNASTTKNPTITVHQGDVVTLTLKSQDGLLHQFLIDADNDGAEAADCPTVDPCSATFSTSAGITYTFTVGLAAGTYTYYCTVHPTSMLGSFIVQSSPVGAPTIPIDKLALLLPYVVFAGLIVALIGTVIYAARSRREPEKTGSASN